MNFPTTNLVNEAGADEATLRGWIRAQYPALESRTLFFDNAAGAQVPRAVVAGITDALTTMNVNRGGAYRESQRVTEAKEAVRARVAAFLNAPRPENVVFGPNATTLVTLLADGVGRTLSPGDEIIVTGLDHHANVDPWRRLSERGLVVKTWQPTGEETRLELPDLNSLLSNKTKLVAMTSASNALGTFTDVAGASKLVHDAGAKLMVDAVHYAPHRLPDVAALGADMLLFSPYKVFGPHLGVLYLSDVMLGALPHHGLSFFPGAHPINWEPGTQNHEAIVGFGGTFDYLDALARELGAEGTERERWGAVFEAFGRLEHALTERLLDGLADLPIKVYGLQTAEGRTATISLNVEGHAPQEVAEKLAAQNIAVASGHYYAYDLMMKHLGLKDRGGAVRVSALHYNTPEEVNALLKALANL